MGARVEPPLCRATGQPNNGDVLLAEPCAVGVAEDLPLPIRTVLIEQFNARPNDQPMCREPLARVSNLQDGAAINALDFPEVRALPGFWFDRPIELLKFKADRWALSSGDSLCVASPTSNGSFDVRCAGPDAAVLVLVAVTEIFRASGWLTVHASGYQSRNRFTTLCLGRSGAGKSVRAVLAAGRGNRFVGEDRVWLRASDMAVVCCDRRVRLLPRGAAVVPSLPSEGVNTDPDGKLRFPIDLLGLEPAVPAVLDEWEVLLGELLQDPLKSHGEERKRDRQLLLSKAAWEAFGVPFLPAAKAHTARAIHQLMKIPAKVWWRTAEGKFRRV